MRTGDAKPFRETKVSQVERLAAENPIWYEDYLNRGGDWGKRIEGMRVIASDPRFVGRTDIALLGEYLDERDRMTNVMAGQAAMGNSYKLDTGDMEPWRENGIRFLIACWRIRRSVTSMSVGSSSTC